MTFGRSSRMNFVENEFLNICLFNKNLFRKFEMNLLQIQKKDFIRLDATSTCTTKEILEWVLSNTVRMRDNWLD